MKLTSKDAEFLERLKALWEVDELKIDLKEDGFKRFVLRQNYGSRIETHFGITRQGVRWRFQRLFGEIYVAAYETIYFIESNFGTQLRSMALALAKQRAQLRQRSQRANHSELPTKPGRGDTQS